jgi:hypothetical protein
MIIERQHQAKVASWTFQYNKEDFVIFLNGLLCYSNHGSRKLFLIPSLWNITHQSGPFNGGCSASSLIWSNFFVFGKRKITEGLLFFHFLKIPIIVAHPLF